MILLANNQCVCLPAADLESKGTKFPVKGCSDEQKTEAGLVVKTRKVEAGSET
jgi:hypothetical protein